MKKDSYINKIKEFFRVLLFRKYRPLVFFVSILAIILISVTCVVLYDSYKKQLHIKLNNSANSIRYSLVTIFSQTEYLMQYVAKNIVQDHKNLEFVYKSLEIPKKYQNQASRSLSLTFFDWVNSDYFQVVNQEDGILEEPFDVSNEQYVKKPTNNPWKMQFSDPMIGFPSGCLVIPVSLGLTDTKDNFIGIISGGFDINVLVSLLKSNLDPQIYFRLVDDELKIILSNIKNDNRKKLTSYYGSSIFHIIEIPNSPYKLIVAITLSKFIIQYLLLIFPYIVIILLISIFTLSFLLKRKNNEI